MFNFWETDSEHSNADTVVLPRLGVDGMPLEPEIMVRAVIFDELVIEFQKRSKGKVYV